MDLMPAIAWELAALGKSVQAVVLVPPLYEGLQRSRNADRALFSLEASGAVVVPVTAERILALHSHLSVRRFDGITASAFQDATLHALEGAVN